MPSASPSDEGMERLAGVLRRSSSRSQLYQWMRRRHAALAGELAEVRPNWAALAREFGAMGLSDGTGKAPSAGVARRTWWQVRRDVAAAEAKRAAHAGATNGLRGSSLAPARDGRAAESTAPLVLEPEEAAEPEMEFRPARLRGRPQPETGETA